MTKKQISRREVLKALAAAAGAAAFAGMPAKWKTPVVQVGALPAHAQGTESVYITDTSEYAENEVAVYVCYNLPAGAVTFDITAAPLSPGGCTINGYHYDPTYPGMGYSFQQVSGNEYIGCVRLVILVYGGSCDFVTLTVSVTDGNTVVRQAQTSFEIPAGWPN